MISLTSGEQNQALQYFSIIPFVTHFTFFIHFHNIPCCDFDIFCHAPLAEYEKRLWIEIRPEQQLITMTSMWKTCNLINFFYGSVNKKLDIEGTIKVDSCCLKLQSDYDQFN